ncbi:ferric reductase NAD binding domain-containing protein [Obelidium mucronatum]|nr:ferric reductase NAD binding domain-containing protein [Obelidium mucronatum]
MNKRAIVTGPAAEPLPTPLAFVMGDSNARAAAVLCGTLWAVFLLSTAVAPLVHRATLARQPTRHSSLAILVHRLTLKEIQVLGVVVSGATMFPALVIGTLLVIFSLNTSLDPALSDIGLQRMATLAVPLMSFSLATALRNSPLSFLGVSPAAVLPWHRWSGVASTVMLLIHGVSYWFQWVHFNFVQGNLGMVRNQWGIGGLALLTLMFLTSLPWIRRKFYYMFYAIHVLVVPCLLTMTYLHAPAEALPYLSPPLAFYVVDKALRLVKSERRVKVLQLAAFSDAHADTSLITVCAPPLCSESGFKAGQYLFINVPEVSATRWHPVSFASRPIPNHGVPQSHQQNQATILPSSVAPVPPALHCCRKPECGVTIVLSGPGPFCRSVNDAVTSRLISASIPPLQVRVDGPYGHSVVDKYKKILPNFIYIAGGIGVTPVLSMLMDRKHFLLSTTLYSSKTDGAATKTVGEGKSRLLEEACGTFIWSVRHLKDVEWALDELVELSKGGRLGFRIIIHVTREEASEILSSKAQYSSGEESEEVTTAAGAVEDRLLDTHCNWIDSRDKTLRTCTVEDLLDGKVDGIVVQFGRPDFGQVLKNCVGNDVGDCGVVVSGPSAMVASVKRAAVEESGSSCLFHVFAESFCF